jgi:hypothetical protein
MRTNKMKVSRRTIVAPLLCFESMLLIQGEAVSAPCTCAYTSSWCSGHATFEMYKRASRSELFP